MISKTLQTKIDHSIALLQKGERIALKYSDKGYHVAFSGGKDSQCILQLAKEAGVKHYAFMSLTGIDPPEVIRFVKSNYPEVELLKPKDSIYNLAVKHCHLPTRRARWCCNDLKETKFANTVQVIGVRHSESFKRSKRNEMEISGHKFSGTEDEFYNEYSDYTETTSKCIKGKENIIVSPIITWTEKEVWEYLNDRNLLYCKLYDEGARRIGCICCPMNGNKSEKLAEIRRYPHVYRNWIKAIKSIKAIKANRKGSFPVWKHTSEEIFDYWISGDNYKKWYAENFLQQKLDFK